MKRTVFASALSLALVMTSFTTAPARADEDVAKILAGMMGLVILNEVVKKNRKPKVQQNTYRPQPIINQNAHRKNKYKKKAKKQVRKVAPQRCLTEQWTFRGSRDVYAAECLERYAKANPPRECLREVRTRDGRRQFYTPYCLRENGWRT